MQMLGSLCAFHAILPIEQVCSSTIGILNGWCAWKPFYLTRAFLAVIAVADSTQNGSTARFEFDASARAPSGCVAFRGLSHSLLHLRGAQHAIELQQPIDLSQGSHTRNQLRSLTPNIAQIKIIPRADVTGSVTVQ